ncbi:MAG: diacylglycerol kinase [Chloroflexi bacterium]|nr:MAG: diacylglycerol kinase [Chloroflexota bacterium]
MLPERIYVILNPYAGRGLGGELKPQILAAFDELGVTVELVASQGVGHAIELARAVRTAGVATVVAAGGDGTVSEVVNGLAQATPAGEPVGRLGIIPIGSGNDFAATVGCPLDIRRAVATICAGATRRVDLGHAAIHTGAATIHRYFDNNLGIGFEAWVTLESYKIKRLRGLALYIVAALRALRTYPTPTTNITWETVNGEVHRRTQPTLLISVGNGPRTGGGFYLTPDALFDDGQLDVGIAASVSRPHILWLLPKAIFGKHTSDPAVTMVRCRTLQVKTDSPAPVHVDGEVLTAEAEWIEVSIEPARLEVIVAQQG